MKYVLNNLKDIITKKKVAVKLFIYEFEIKKCQDNSVYVPYSRNI